jgi:hypothetical protein
MRTPSNKAPGVTKNAPAASNGTVSRTTLVLATLLGVAALAPSMPLIASAGSQTAPGATASPRAQASRKLAAPPRVVMPAKMLAQILAQGLTQDDDDTGDATADKGASPDQIEKYVTVYRAMQRNHSLTIEQAAASQGMTVQAFRDLERRIESDDLARDDARRALAAPADGATPAATPKARH